MAREAVCFRRAGLGGTSGTDARPGSGGASPRQDGGGTVRAIPVPCSAQAPRRSPRDGGERRAGGAGASSADLRAGLGRAAPGARRAVTQRRTVEAAPRASPAAGPRRGSRPRMRPRRPRLVASRPGRAAAVRAVPRAGGGSGRFGRCRGSGGRSCGQGRARPGQRCGPSAPASL